MVATGLDATAGRLTSTAAGSKSAGPASAIGKMFFSEDLAYWAGAPAAVSGLPSGATFGVSLVDADGDPVVGPTRSWSARSADRPAPAASPRRPRRIASDRLVGRRRVEIGAMEEQQALGGLGADVEAVLAPATADSQAASRGRSTASTSASRRRESMTTSQTSPAPTTSPTMSSQTLNSAFTRGEV